jgi:hypothetical protein
VLSTVLSDRQFITGRQSDSYQAVRLCSAVTVELASPNPSGSLVGALSLIERPLHHEVHDNNTPNIMPRTEGDQGCVDISNFGPCVFPPSTVFFSHPPPFCVGKKHNARNALFSV